MPQNFAVAGEDEIFDDYRLNVQTDARPSLELLRRRLMALAALGAAIVIVLGYLLRGDGVRVGKLVLDPVGSSKNAEDLAEILQTAYGYFNSFTEKANELYFEAVLATIVTYLVNYKWGPRDDTCVRSRAKLWFVVYSTPIAVYLVNVSFTSAYIDKRVVGVSRTMTDNDLRTQTNLTNVTGGLNETLLYGAVTRQTHPFRIDRSSCSANSDSIDGNAPTLQDISSTSVNYGFRLRDWNSVALSPQIETRSENFLTYNDFSKTGNASTMIGYELLYQGVLFLERNWADATDVRFESCLDREVDDQALHEVEPDFATATLTTESESRRLRGNHKPDAIYQDRERGLFYAQDGQIFDAAGLYLMPTSVAQDFASLELKNDSEFTKYRVDEDGFLVDAQNKFVVARDSQALIPTNAPPDGEVYDYGVDLCRGGRTAMAELVGFDKSENQTPEMLQNYAIASLKKFFPIEEDKNVTTAFETMTFNEHISAKMLKIHVVYDGSKIYHNASESCRGNASSLCADGDKFPFAFPDSMCGANECVFPDQEQASPRKQVQAMPYLSDFNLNLQYNANLQLMLPKQQRVNTSNLTSLFLYGYGSSMRGEKLGMSANGIPYIKNPRRHIVLTFAKLEWQFTSLSHFFNSKCKTGHNCDGLYFKLHHSTNATEDKFAAIKKKYKKGDRLNYLLISNDTVAQTLADIDLESPITLVQLVKRPIVSPDLNNRSEWEYLHPNHFAETSAQFHIPNRNCSPEVDAFITQVKQNRYWMDDPTYPLYASAIFFLFQDAALKQAQEIRRYRDVFGHVKFKSSGFGYGEPKVALELAGNKERKIIIFKVPGSSASLTCAAVAVMWICALLLLLGNQPKQKMRADQSLAEQFVDMLNVQAYPSEVHRRLIVVNKEEIPAHDFDVEEIAFFEHADPCNQFSLTSGSRRRIGREEIQQL